MEQVRQHLDFGEPVRSPKKNILETLSAREFEVAKLASVGFSNKEIARALQISPHTVSSHLRQTFTKLGIRRRAALARAVVELSARSKQIDGGLV